MSGGSYSWEVLVGMCRPVPQILSLFQAKNVTFHTRFQTRPLQSTPVFSWPLSRNYVIITEIKVQTKNSSNPFRILHISLSFLLIWNWNDKYVACENIRFSSLFAAVDVSRGNVHSGEERRARRNGCFRRLRKPYPILDQNGQIYPFSDQNGAKTLPDRAAHTSIAYIREYPPPPPAWSLLRT